MKTLLKNRTTLTKEHLINLISFTTAEITDLLCKIGLVCNGEKCRVEEFERLVFLYGNEHEIYGSDERLFIERVGSVYIYNDISRQVNKGMITTQIFTADLCQFSDGVRSCFFFMKVINKANDGFNIFLFRTNEGFFLGCRIYDKDPYNNCILTSAIQYNTQLDELIERLYLPLTNKFIPFYSSLVEAIEYRDTDTLDYDLKIKLKGGVSFAYLDTLSDIENNYNLNLDYAKEMYYRSFDEKDEIIDDFDYSTVKDELSFIKSDRTNTLEMLFEAEEMALLANETEQNNEQIVLLLSETTERDTSNDNILKEYLDNPELMIKMLKAQKGLKDGT